VSARTLRGRRGAALALVLAAALALPACSSDSNGNSGDPVADAQARDESAQQQQERQVEQANAALPDRPTGQIDIDGSNSLSLTRQEVSDYQATGTNTVVNLQSSGEGRAFQQLCAGKIDMVSSMRPINRNEWDACQAVGLDVVQFQIASDAIVIAIASETDVGGDCLNTDQVQEIWRAGSPVTNWNQVGFDDIPLKVGGPQLTSKDFEVFGKSVLGSLAPALTDVRSDYFTYKNFDEARKFLNGGPKRIKLSLTYPERARERGVWRSAVVSQKQVWIDARAELRAALANRAKGYRDQRNAADQAKDEARVQAAYVARTKAQLKLQRYQQRLKQAERSLAVATKAKRYADGTLGHVIYARFSDYEIFEDQLRPFEITLPDGRRNCVFPSQRTITGGDYPFASQVLLTTTTRSLGRKEVQDFIRHYLNTAQESAARAHLVALPDETLRAELAWLDGSRQPVLVVPDEDGEISSNATESPTPSPTSTAQQPAR
jgi:ABC-type phosphate transport system substrate-binding protein